MRLIRATGNSPYARPWYRKPLFRVLTVAAVVLTVVAGLWLNAWNGLSKPTTFSPSESSNGFNQTGVQPYGANVPVGSNFDATRAHAEYPEYYKCRTYPDDAHLTPSDLIPTANVIVNITYDASKQKYVVTGDPRITVTEQDVVQQPNSDFAKPTTQQMLTFGFGANVRYFATYTQYHSSAPGSPFTWGGGPTLYDNYGGVNHYRLTLTPADSVNAPRYVVVATDITTCAAGTTSLPQGFDWNQLADNGLLLPEYYMSGQGHPQG